MLGFVGWNAISVILPGLFSKLVHVCKLSSDLYKPSEVPMKTKLGTWGW